MPTPLVGSSRIALIQAFCNRPVLAVIVGVLMMLVGFAALGYPFYTSVVSVKVLGVFFLATAFVHAFLLPSARDWTGVVWHLLGIILYAIAGIVIFREPVQAVGLLTLVLGILFFVGGVGRVAFAFAVRGAPGWGLALFNGIVTVILGLMIVFEWPASSLWAIGVIVAIDVMFSGAMLLGLGLSGRNEPQAA